MASEQSDAAVEDREFKAGQRAMWALGDYHEFARRSLWGFGQQLVEACGIGPGQRVLDVAAGSGNVAIRAAQAGAEVIASDLTPENFEAGRREAALHGVQLEWVEADAEALPFADDEFDVVTSAFGAVFTPHHQLVADELVRVCRPGGTIGLTVPTPPAGKTDYVRMLADLPSKFGAPLRWGDKANVAGLFGERIESLEMGRLRTELGFANEAELRDFLKAYHPVGVALYSERGEDPEPGYDPELAAALDDALLGAVINVWYARGEGGSGTFAQEAVYIVARKRRVTPPRPSVRGVSADHDRIRVPLHPQCAQFLEMVEQAGEPPLYELSPEAARARAEAQAELIGPGPEVAAVDDIAVPVRDDEIPARRYEPESSSATLVWFPGGGWVFDGLGNHDAMCRRLAHVASSTVICVGHRLAPEHRFPAPLDDCWDALNWAAQQHPSVPLMVGGDSSGGNLAAVCALRARDRGRPALALQVLVYPVTDHDMTTASYVEHGAGALIGRQEMEWFWNHYVDVAQRETPEVSPLRAPDVSKLPPAIAAVAEYDPLRDDGLAYAERLRAAGTAVTLRRYDDVFHGFFSMVNVFERANEAIDAVGGDIRSAISAQAVR